MEYFFNVSVKLKTIKSKVFKRNVLLVANSPQEAMNIAARVFSKTTVGGEPLIILDASAERDNKYKYECVIIKDTLYEDEDYLMEDSYGN